MVCVSFRTAEGESTQLILVAVLPVECSRLSSGPYFLSSPYGRFVSRCACARLLTVFVRPQVLAFDPEIGADTARQYASKYCSKPEKWYQRGWRMHGRIVSASKLHSHLSSLPPTVLPGRREAGQHSEGVRQSQNGSSIQIYE